MADPRVYGTVTSHSLTDALRETLGIFEGSGDPLTTSEVADSLGLGRRSTYERLERLAEQDRIQTKKVGANARVWWRTDRSVARDGPGRAMGGSLIEDVLDGAEVGVFVLDENLEVAWTNDVVEEYFGIDRERVRGRDKRTLVAERIAPIIDDGESFAETVLATYGDNTDTERFECLVTAGEGREARWLEHHSKPIESGVYAGGRVELYHDVTGRKSSERARQLNRTQFESLAEAVGEYGIFSLDADGHVRTWNPGAEQIKGYEAEEILGEHVSVFYTDEDREAGVPERNLAAAARRGSVEDEGWRVRADGSRFWANVTTTAIRDDDGDLAGYAKVTRDMADRREREQELRRERDLLERVLDASPTGIGIFDADGEPRRVNRRFAEYLGLDGDAPVEYELGDQPVRDEDGDVIPYPERPAPRALATGESVVDQRVRIDGPHDQPRWFSVNAEPLRDDEGVVVTMADVTRLTERSRRLEHQRDDFERELDGVFERVDDAFLALDDEWRFTFVNDRAAHVLDRPAEALVGEVIWEAFPDAAGGPFQEAYERAVETQESVTVEEFYPPLGVWFEVNAYPSESGLSVYFRDVTERKERERELEQYETMLETVEDGIYVVDDETTFAFVNDAYCEQTGYSREELLGSHVSLVVDDQTVERALEQAARLHTGDVDEVTFEADLQRKDGGRLPTEATFTLLPGETPRRIGVVRDITERRWFEETLTALHESAQALQRAPDAEEVGEAVLEAATEVIDLPGVAIYRHDAERDLLVPDAASLDAGFIDQELPVVPSGEDSITGRAFEAGEPREHEDVFAATTPYLDAEETEMRGGLFVPMGEHGVLVAGARESGSFDRRTRRLVELLAADAEAAYDRVERERELEEYRRWNRTLVENFPSGAVALVDEEFRYVTFGGTVEGDTDLTEADLAGSRVREVLPEEIAEVVVPGYEAALDGDPSEFQDTVGDRIYQFHFVPVRDDDGEVFAAAGMSQEVTERVERERRIEHQREQLAALDQLNAIVRDVTEAVIDQSTRAEIERVVCERLADADSYEFAWIGAVDGDTQRIVPRTEAGVEGYLEEATVSVDPDEAEGWGPAGKAARTQEMQVSHDALTDADFEPWREYAERYGYRSSAAIPIVHDGTLYGLLGVYADRPRAFENEEGAVVSQLGEIVGHAIAAVDRKRALLSDDVIELQFCIRNLFEVVGVDVRTGGPITFDHAIPIGDGEYLLYGTASADAVDSLEALLDAVPHWTDVAFRGDGAEVNFELRLSEPPVLSTIVALNGSFEDAVIEDGDYLMTAHFPPGVDVRRFVDTVQETYPTMDLLKQHQITRRDETADRVRSVLTTELTDRQRAALEAAYHSGFFEWPRDASGEDVADSLDIAPATFHQHLRKAEKKVFHSLLSTPAPA
jgi:PAS domain S-box-containing protein